MMSITAETVELLLAAGVDARDTHVTGTPPGMYAVVSDRDPGLSQPHRMSPTPHWTRTTIDVRIVARTVHGLRDLARTVKATLSGRRLPSGVILQELEVSPWMTTGTAGDQRHEMTITYRTTTPTRGEGTP